MRVLMINTAEREGGPAIAAYRLTEALKSNGIQAKMLVRHKTTDQVTTVVPDHAWTNQLGVLTEHLSIRLHLHGHHSAYHAVDFGQSGNDITALPEFRQADVIHLHWVSDGMLSLASLEKIIASGKPIVWTLHDMWPFTGVCHYAHFCDRYHHECHHCPQMYSHKQNDMAHRVFLRKQSLLHDAPIQFVSCSHWLAQRAAQSNILQGHTIECIPNAVNVNLFQPRSKQAARQQLGLPTDRRLVLFSAYSFADERKGFRYFVAACHALATAHPEWKQHLGIVLLGHRVEQVREADLPFPVYIFPYADEEKYIVEVYNAVDLYAIPSLQDNLPNTIVEAMACGVPCIGFNVGGIPEMIDHLHNGYVAEYKDVEAFAAGIHWLLTEGDYDILSSEATRKAISSYSESKIAMQYISIYNQITGTTIDI